MVGLGLEAVQLSESASIAYQIQLNALEHLDSAATKFMVDVMGQTKRRGKLVVSAFDCNALSMYFVYFIMLSTVIAE